MSWVIVTPGGAEPMTLTSFVATDWPSPGLRIVSPEMRALAPGAEPAVAPGPKPPPEDDGVAGGRLTKPYAMRPIMMRSPATMTAGTRGARPATRVETFSGVTGAACRVAT